ncbi:MAG: hypothetical protein O3A00_22250 [Planctomycetota bacterium]|nr:hypothetical protein [Planctomycetota bacterium]
MAQNFLSDSFAESRRVLIGMAVVWLLLVGPAYLISGTRGLEGLSFAALLCALPVWPVFWFVAKMSATTVDSKPNPAAPALAVVGGGGARMMVALIGCLVLTDLRSDFTFWDFTIWLLVFYLVALALESWLVLRRISSQSVRQSSADHGEN